MPGFDDSLTASIAAAKAKLEERERILRVAQQMEREQARAVAEKFADVKGRAMRFSNNKLEPLFRKLQQKVAEAGFRFIGNFIDDEGPHQGVVGRTLECGEDCWIQAAIDYSLDKSIARVAARTSKGLCHSASQEFSEATSLEWFEANIVESIGKLLESGEVPSGGFVRNMA